MRRRHLLGLVGLVALLALAGCSTVFGPGEPDPEQINQNVSYEWDVDANATINVTRDQYTSVYRVQNQSTIELYGRDALGTESPLEIRGLKFQFPNGTVRNVSTENVSLTRKRAEIEVPARDGKVAFTSPRRGKEFNSPTFTSGTYEVTLPPNARVGVPILAQVSPRDYTTSVEDDRVTIRWENVESRSISVRYYLQRDLLIFGSLIGILVLAGAVGALYYLRQIRSLERRREEVGLDIEDDDDPRDDGPPPGMR